MISKALYGIDPDAVYPWSPRAAFRDKNEQIRQDAEALMLEDGFTDLPEDERKAIVKRATAPEELELIDGAPVVYLGPLTGKMAMRVQAARQKIQRIHATASRRTHDRLLRLTAEQQDETGDIREEEAEKAVEAAGAVFTEEFEAEVLASVLRGWDNLTRPDGTPISCPENKVEAIDRLPSLWRSSIVYDVVNETAWSKEAVEGFGSRQESSKG